MIVFLVCIIYARYLEHTFSACKYDVSTSINKFIIMLYFLLSPLRGNGAGFPYINSSVTLPQSTYGMNDI